MPILGILASIITGGLVTDAGAMFPIRSYVVPSGGAASIEWTSIPSTYTHLQIRATLKSSTSSYIALQFNGVFSGSAYDGHGIDGNGSSVTAYAYNSRDNIPTFSDGISTTQYSGLVLDILDYANTNKNKTARWLAGFDNNGSGNIYFESGLWRSTSAITSIKLFSGGSGTFSQYSSFALYGVLA